MKSHIFEDFQINQKMRAEVGGAFLMKGISRRSFAVARFVRSYCKANVKNSLNSPLARLRPLPSEIYL